MRLTFDSAPTKATPFVNLSHLRNLMADIGRVFLGTLLNSYDVPLAVCILPQQLWHPHWQHAERLSTPPSYARSISDELLIRSQMYACHKNYLNK